MDAILGLLGICGANCAEDRDADSKGRTEGVVSVAYLPFKVLLVSSGLILILLTHGSLQADRHDAGWRCKMCALMSNSASSHSSWVKRTDGRREPLVAASNARKVYAASWRNAYVSVFQFNVDICVRDDS